MLTFDSLDIFGNNRHGWPMEGAPQPRVHASYFWGTSVESHILGGRGSRMIICNGIFGSASVLANQVAFSTALKALHDKITFSKGDLVISHNSETKTWTDCFLLGVEAIPQPGQKLPVPLQDVIGGTIGPAAGGYWMELVVRFIKD